MAGASLHTGGSIPHRVHWNRMKEEKGEDPSFSEFYFRTHRKRDQSWVGGIAQSAYERFEHNKLEISSQNTFVSGEDEVNSQPTIDMPPDMDIWVDTVGKKKARVFGLGSLSKTLISSSNQPTSVATNTKEVDDLRSQVHALNASLQRQEQEKLQMRQQLQRQDQEMKETNKKLSFLMCHLGFNGSSSHPPNEKSTNEDEENIREANNEDEDEENFREDDCHEFEEDPDGEDYNYNEYENLN